MSTRTFIAVEIAPNIRQRASAIVRQLQPLYADVNWVTPQNMHWTLQFLDEVDDTLLPKVCDATAIAAADIASFELQVRGAGAFPSIQKPRTLWLGAGQGIDPMRTLQAAIEKSLDKLGFRGERRRYTPHITLGRIRHGRPPQELTEELAALADFDGGTMLVEEATVFESELTPDGSEYSILARCPLTG